MKKYFNNAENYARRCAIQNMALQRRLSRTSEEVILEDAEKRLTMAMERDGSTATAPRNGRTATKSFVEWIVLARRKLASWSPVSGDPIPVTLDDVEQKKRQAVKDGADPTIVDSLNLVEPKGLMPLSAERRMIESIVGPGAMR